jgi:hypothetical protein
MLGCFPLFKVEVTLKLFGSRELRLPYGALALVVAGLTLLICPQSRADQVYTSVSTFNANATGVTVIDFTGLAGASHGASLLGLPLVIGGVSFSSPGPASVLDPQNSFVPAPLYGDGDYLFADYGSPDTIAISLPGSTAIGFTVGGVFGDPATITVTLSDGTTEILTPTSGNYITAGTLDFVGFTSVTPITSLSIVFLPEDAQFGAIDNFEYGTAAVSAVPEPSNVVLLGSGLMASAGALRRRIFWK